MIGAVGRASPRRRTARSVAAAGGRLSLSLAVLVGAVGVFPGCGGRQAKPPATRADAEPAPAPPAESTGPAVPWFADVTDLAGLDFVHVHGGTGRKYIPETMGAGGCALDYDGDGRIDLYLVQSGALPGAAYPPGARPSAVNRLYRNRGGSPEAAAVAAGRGGAALAPFAPRFEDVTDRSRTGDAGYGQGAVCADYDGDGDPDIYVLNFGANALYRNDGDGTFTEVGRAAGVADPRWGSSGVFFDADLDGDLDLYVVNYLDFTVAGHVDCGDPSRGRVAYCHPDAYPPAADVFYRNRGDGTFEDATAAAGLTDATGKGLGAVAADFDADGDPDLYVTNDATPNFYYRNRGDGTFEEVGLLLGVSHNEEGLTEAGMGVDAGDVDGDGRLDLIVANLSRETNALYLGGADAFTYATRQRGLHAPSFPYVGFGLDLADFDGDGDLDLFVANGHVIDDIETVDDALTFKQPSQLFLNDGGGNFTELEPRLAGPLAVPRVARGTITLDLDDDGRVDLAVAFNDDRARLFRNTGAGGGGAANWIGFSLQGAGANRDAVGARVVVDTPGRTQLDERKAGSSYETSGDPRLHFGLGRATAAARVTVRWPDGAVQTFEHLPGGRYYRLRQGGRPGADE